MLKLLKNFLGDRVRGLLGGRVDEETLEKLEQLFFEADLGAETAEALTEKIRDLYKRSPGITTDEILSHVQEELIASFPPSADPPLGSPHVMLIVGVNGNGKTTTVAKLGHLFQNAGKKVVVTAADTFRAAATEQLSLWAEKAHLDIVKGLPGSDPAAVVFDAIESAKDRLTDVVLVDTAGRLHTKTDLMQELEKIHRVSGKALSGAPHETLLVLDATIGQNALEQALTFHRFTPLTGLILTKLDGTAKGGIAIALQKKLNLPIRYIGIGEGLDDLKPFDPKDFVTALFN